MPTDQRARRIRVGEPDRGVAPRAPLRARGRVRVSVKVALLGVGHQFTVSGVGGLLVRVSSSAMRSPIARRIQFAW